MPNTEGNAQSQRLMANLGRLVDGNHAQAHELQATGLREDSYSVDAWVTWRFEHDSRTRSVHGNGAASTHFGFDMAAFQAHRQALGRDATSNREIRVAFMQTITLAAENSLGHSCEARLVKEYGACSVHLQCDGCRGTGNVSCSGCSGSGRRSCGQCGGSGTRWVQVNRQRWNGNRHETYVAREQQHCSGCGGGARVVCGPCGGSGRQRCSGCSGHGYLTDIVETWALARPHWWVRTSSGLASELLQDFMAKCGPGQALDLVPSLNLLDTGYDDSDRWVVHYRGEADVIEQGIGLRNQSWTVPAAGPKPVPMNPAPVFDYLFAAEIAHVRELQGARKQTNVPGRMARQLFRTYRELPALDKATQAIATLVDGAEPACTNAVSHSMGGFISTDAARHLGGAIQGMLNKVSPPYSVLAWVLVMAAPITGVCVTVAMTLPHHDVGVDALLGVAGVTGSGALGVLLSSPLAWALSAVISGLHRLRVPKQYRQKGRNWVPLLPSLKAVMLAAALGLTYGLAVKYLGMPAVDPAVRAASVWAAGTDVFATPERAVVPVQPVSKAATFRAIQHYLNGHGYPVGLEDGQVGGSTAVQMSRYMHRHHLPNDMTPEAVLADMQQRH